MSKYFREDRLKRLTDRYARLLLQRLPLSYKEALCDAILEEVLRDLAKDLLHNHARPHLLSPEEITMLARMLLLKE